ncbi:MAG: LamG-like jellyroll fold domain-containing protein [Candidatus Hodarchaeota archaeon]
MTAYSEGSLIFRISNSTYYDKLIVENALLTGLWYNIAAVWGQKSMKLFINGTLLAEKDTLVKNLYLEEYPEDYVQIGTDAGGNYPYWYFHGIIDEVSIFNGSSSSKEIVELMDASLSSTTTTNTTTTTDTTATTINITSDLFTFPFIISTFILMIIVRKKRD